MLCVIHICVRDMHMDRAGCITKVVLMPSLLWYYLSVQVETGLASRLVTFALLLHTIGDFFLLFPKKRTMFTIGGASFLLGHFFYIWYLALHLRYPGNMLIIAALAIWPLTIIFKLVRKTPAPAPMFAYAITLVLVALFSAGAGDIISLFGVVFFAVSDTMLGYNTIQEKFTDVCIMATYLFGEFLIIVGFLLLQGAF